MGKPGFVYETGRDPNEYRSAEAFSRYAHRQLGVEVPIGRERTIWYSRLKREMEAHGWDWEDMAKTVRYMKAHRIKADKIAYLLYQVQKALKWSEQVDDWDLHGKVADAIAQEEDETWRRRLSLAKGKALEQVYRQWREERGEV